MAQVVMSDTVNGDTNAPSAVEPLVCMQLFSEDNEQVAQFGPPLTNSVLNEEHPDHARHLTLQKNSLWPNGSELTVKFLDSPSKFCRDKVVHYGFLWSQFANIKFKLVEGATPAQIRISFIDKNSAGQSTGSWSMVGKDCMSVKDQHRPTMNFGWLNDKTSDTEFSRVVTHEFGHAIGAVHEQFNPGLHIHWKKDVVYEYFKRTNGWDQAEVNNNFHNFTQIAENEVVHTQWDPDSIMHYPIKKEWNTDGIEVVQKTQLSDKDKQFAARIYPKPH